MRNEPRIMNTAPKSNELGQFDAKIMGKNSRSATTALAYNDCLLLLVRLGEDKDDDDDDDDGLVMGVSVSTLLLSWLQWIWCCYHFVIE